MLCLIKPISYTRFRDSCSEELIKIKQLRRAHHNTVLTPIEWKTFHDYYTLHIAQMEQPLPAIKFFIYSAPAGPYKSIQFYDVFPQTTKHESKMLSQL